MKKAFQELFNIFKNKSDNSIVITHKIIQPKKSLIWLHGLGDAPESFQTFFQKQQIISDDFWVVLMAAPNSKVTFNEYIKMTSWFDIKSFDPNDYRYSFEDILKSSKIVQKQIEKEYELLKDYKSIYLGGFSQGAILSVHIGLTYEHQLGGIIACSGFLCKETQIIDQNKNVKILALNGDKDELINFEQAKKSYLNSSASSSIDFVQMNDTGHNINDFAIQKMAKFLKD